MNVSALFRTIILGLVCVWSCASYAAEADICCDALSDECQNKQHAYTGRKVALLIGVREYSVKLSPLENPLNDARDLAKILRANGFSARCIKNPKRKEALSELKHLASYVFAQDEKAISSENTRLIVYFAGHGMSLDGSDYFFFSTNSPLTTKAEVLEAALSRKEVFDEFAGLANFEPHYIFDSCRKLFEFNLADTPSGKSRVASHGSLQAAETSNPRIVGGYYVIHSTTKTGIALDTDPDTPGNGAFMARFKQEIDFPNLELQTAVQFTVRGLQLRGITAVPAQEGAGQFWQQTLPIKRMTSVCEEKAANIWLNTRSCGALSRQCTLPKACGLLRGVDTAQMTCLKPLLESRLGYDPVEQCALQAALNVNPVTELFALSVTPNFASTSLDATQNFTAKVASSQMGPNSGAASPETLRQLAVPLPQDAQIKLRDTLLPRLPATGSAPAVTTFGNDAALKMIPSASGGTIRMVKSGTPLRLNCNDALCTDQWVAVSASIDKTTVRGWLPAAQLVPALELRYDADGLFPQRRDLAALNLKLKLPAGAAREPIRLTAVQPRGASLLSESRLIRLTNYIADLGVPRDKITVAIRQVEQLDRPAFVELSVLQDIPDFSTAYQPQPRGALQ